MGIWSYRIHLNFIEILLLPYLGRKGKALGVTHLYGDYLCPLKGRRSMEYRSHSIIFISFSYIVNFSCLVPHLIAASTSITHSTSLFSFSFFSPPSLLGHASSFIYFSFPFRHRSCSSKQWIWSQLYIRSRRISRA